MAAKKKQKVLSTKLLLRRAVNELTKTQTQLTTEQEQVVIAIKESEMLRQEIKELEFFYGERIGILQRRNSTLETEKSCLMEVIIKLGEDIGEDNSEIENLKSINLNQTNHKTKAYKIETPNLDNINNRRN